MVSIRLKAREYLIRLFKKFPDFKDKLRMEGGLAEIIRVFHEAEFGTGQREYVELMLGKKIYPVEKKGTGGLIVRFRSDAPEFNSSDLCSLEPVEGVIEELFLQGFVHRPNGKDAMHLSGDQLLFGTLINHFPNLSLLDIRETHMDDPGKLSVFLAGRLKNFPGKQLKVICSQRIVWVR